MQRDLDPLRVKFGMDYGIFIRDAPRNFKI